MAEAPQDGVEGGTPQSAQAAVPQQSAQSVLLEFASAAKSGVPGSIPIPEELEGVIRDVAHSGAAGNYPWEALRLLLARKMELVLHDFWNDSQDVGVTEGQTFSGVVVEPLTKSLLEPSRDCPPFTLQRICELLVEPRRMYKSTRKFFYALERTLSVTMSEEEVTETYWGCTGATANETADAASASAELAAAASRKRKLPPELANGVVSEHPE
mmetsp:Transcript_147163/g.256885  ORF Transcript_147163/g.256885 Transcript_147163/m.256885 type:complete len:213 (+) Transcript_147163:46-684(+)